MRDLIDRIEEMIGPTLPDGVNGVTVTIAHDDACDKLIHGKARYMLRSLAQIVGDIILGMNSDEDCCKVEIDTFRRDLTTYVMAKLADTLEPTVFSCEVKVEGLDLDKLFGRDEDDP